MDDIDIANDRTAAAIDKTVDSIRRNATIAPGVEGDCDLCGEYMLRLICGACAPCRDKYKLP